ncbi:MAG: hypothetical protein QG549_738, partial [Patescibacteria group bacterium]|nr:hypothetical protein [Patescibacteria group bacterium]
METQTAITLVPQELII